MSVSLERRRRGWPRALALSAVLLGMFTASAASAACQMIVNADLAVRFTSNRPLVEASIDGTPVWLEVDTGAYTSVLFQGAAERLGLKGYDTGYRLRGVGGEVEVLRVEIGDFALGTTHVKKFAMNIAGGARIRSGGGGDDREVVGLLGRDFLGLTDVELDLAHDKIRLLTFKDCGSRPLAYWSETPSYVEMGRQRAYTQEEFYFPLQINGYYVRAVLDSGAALTVVTPSVASHSGVVESDFRDAGRGTGIGNHAVVRHTATFTNIDLGDEKIKTAVLTVMDLIGREDQSSTGSHTGGGGLPMLLGADFLHSHRVLIASSQDRIYYTYLGGPVFHNIASDTAPRPKVNVEPEIKP